MISILIPIYNYNAYPLVEALYNESAQMEIDVEIIGMDDASTVFVEENSNIAGLPLCRLERLPQNSGRSKVRNQLVQQAQYDWLLFLDADVFPDSPDFIQQYVNAIHDTSDVICGGLSYHEQQPARNYRLRWEYGRHREALSLKKRLKKHYESLFFSNLLIRKQLFSQLTFNEGLSGYGYEDLVFSTQLKALNARVSHIQNTVCHLQLDTSEIFLEKTEKALHNLKYLIDDRIIGNRSTRLARTHHYIKKIGLQRLARTLFLTSKNRLRRKLLSESPSLFIFDLYKLGYFCAIDTDR